MSGKLIERAEIEARLVNLREQLQELDAKMYAIRGAIEAYTDLLEHPNAATSPSLPPRNLKKK